MEGEYYLQGQREMASGFLLKPEGEFQFFFSYGALDRHGSGTWRSEGDKLVLNSMTRPGNDFTLVESSKVPGSGITVSMDTPNPSMVRSIYCSLEKGIDGSWTPMDGKGVVSFPQQAIETICLLLEFCPERFTTIPVNPEHNGFIVRIEPTILEVFFENFTLQVDQQGLSGAHPLMKGDSFSYEKQ